MNWLTRRGFLKSVAGSSLSAGLLGCMGADGLFPAPSPDHVISSTASPAPLPSKPCQGIPSMKQVFDCSQLDWVVAGLIPDLWRFLPPRHIAERRDAEIPAVPVRVPGSVQQALLDAGHLPDWNIGLNARLCEWVENRDWIFEVTLPDEWFRPGLQYRLHCLGLDYCGEVVFNGHDVGAFNNAFVPHVFDLTPHLLPTENVLQIAFTPPPPRAMGQFSWTSRATDWKPRFNFFWNWVCRLVQVGIWDAVYIEASDGREITHLRCVGDADPQTGKGALRIHAAAAGAETRVRLTLEDGERTLREELVDPARLAGDGLLWDNLDVRLWWPNGLGDQPLYTLRCELLDRAGARLDVQTRRVGFRHVAWEPCRDAPAGAEPWICVVNGRRLFLQGVNWTPIRPNFADVPREEYQRRLQTYRDLHMNMLRVWGGAFLEKECFYDLCDELGLMVWQEMPLSSSGRDSYPPDTEPAMTEQCAIARSYVERRQHHPALIMWCGGNELTERGPERRPIDLRHPLMARFAAIFQQMDPTRRFIPTSPSGPVGFPTPDQVGKGILWNAHGPWEAHDLEEWDEMFRRDDALFRAEIGDRSASPIDLIRRTRGELPEMPPTPDNPLWRRQPWNVSEQDFRREVGRPPATLEEFVDWSQRRQTRTLTTVAESCKRRFPRCGGVLFWMGHDCFPCAGNNSLLDFDGRPKPAALAIGEIFKRPVTG